MEFIQKKISIITTTGHTTGCTGNCYVIIPYSGTGITYSFNINLSANATDLGFFHALEEGDDVIVGCITCDELSGVTSGTSECQTDSTFPTGVTTNGVYLVSGSSSSRLSEVRKFSTDGTLEQLYFISTDPVDDGVDNTETVTGLTASTYVYYVGGITYVDYEVSGETTETYFMFESSGYSSAAFVNLPYIYYEEQGNIIEKPIVDNDVFIIRGKASAFEDNYRLKNIRNLTELTYYAGGSHFNIIENT